MASTTVKPPDPQEILRARARRLSRPAQSAPAPGDALEVLIFHLGGERYALETNRVREVYPLRDLTPLPCTPPFVLGVVNVRGRVVPVIDIKRFFGLPEQGLTDLHRIILVSSRDIELGLLADVMSDVRAIAADSLQQALPTMTEIGADYLKGVTADRLVVLDLERILTDPRIIVDEQVED